MDTSEHTLATLFDQLGLDSTDKAIEDFIDEHRPLAKQTELHLASFWNASQSAFLKQEIENDADWAEVIDHLDAMLR